MDLQAIDYFVKVAEAQSLSRASKLFGLPKSSLNRQREANNVPRYCVEIVRPPAEASI